MPCCAGPSRMPEGDTVYRAAQQLDAGLSGQVLTRSDFRIPSLATKDLSGATVTETVSRGKHLLTRFDNGVTLHTHLKMEGHWAVHPVGTRWRRPAHTARVVLRTTTTEAVGFSVVMDLVRTEKEDELVDHLGPDLLGPDWDADLALSQPAVPTPTPRSATRCSSSATSPGSATCSSPSSASSAASTRRHRSARCPTCR